MIRWSPAYVALGSNLGNPRAEVEAAYQRLAALPVTRLEARSRLYRSRPMGPQDQPQFVNAAAGLLTQLPAGELLEALKKIERDMGRQPPPVRWGPRLIDLDLLLHGATEAAGPDLTLPHPGIHERNFVLYPLADLAPSLRIPRHGTVASLARRLGDEGLQVVN